MEIKVGFLTSYDYEFLKQSLPIIYDAADKIVIAIDVNKKTWAGKPFDIPASFFRWIKDFDLKNKVSIYEDEFFLAGFKTMELETRERNLVAKKLGEGGWHFQVDGDEYFTNFQALVTELRSIERKINNRKVTIYAYWKTIFKITEEGYYIISGRPESVPIVSNNPNYDFHRTNSGNEVLQLNSVIIHQSWGRDEKDLETKLKNWGHNADFDTDEFLNFWRSINKYNYRYFRNFHPIIPELWEKLEFIPATSIDQLIKQIPHQLPLPKKNLITKSRKWIPPVVYNRLAKFLPR